MSETHGVKEWLFSGYEELCLRGTPPSLEEGQQLGVKTVLKIWEAQQEMMQRGFCRLQCCKAVMDRIIKTKFEL